MNETKLFELVEEFEEEMKNSKSTSVLRRLNVFPGILAETEAKVIQPSSLSLSA